MKDEITQNRTEKLRHKNVIEFLINFYGFAEVAQYVDPLLAKISEFTARASQLARVKIANHEEPDFFFYHLFVHMNFHYQKFWIKEKLQAQVGCFSEKVSNLLYGCYGFQNDFGAW